MDTSPQAILDLFSRLRQDMSGLTSTWEECGRVCMMRKQQALINAVNRTNDVSLTWTPYDAAILNSTASEANETLAAGCAAWITPADSPWFVWEPAEGFKSDAVRGWLAECSNIARVYMAASNFYNSVNELYLDRNTYGTAVFFAEQGKKTALNFTVFDPGSYVIADDVEGVADVLMEEVPLTARQAVERFGRDNPALPGKLKESEKTKPNDLFRFIHALYPREPQDQDAERGSQGMPVADCWISVDEKKEVEKSGYSERPFFVNRYLRASRYSPWGTCPTMKVLPEIRGAQYIEMKLANLADVTVDPRIIIPQGFTGLPDLRSAGITMGGLTRDTFPQEWLTGGKLDWGLNWLERVEKRIEAAYHKPLFDQFSEIERQITAAEVHAREAEKVARFSPAFYRLTTELINPVMERVFMLLYRQRKFPPPPMEALYTDAAGALRLAFPQTVLTSRMALAMQAIRKQAVANTIAMWLPYVETTRSQVFDNLNEDGAFRTLVIGDGLSGDDFLKKEDEVDQTRQARQAAQQQQQQNEIAMEAMKSQPLVKAGLNAAGMPQAA